ncbi:magnesium transporter [uncultured Clostridium sp.]|uniref:magnesium transporter n=1 Tax=uncultured Clostridium sp. TaxID=59620 RepID=UPI0025DF871C|nr:magnesium transporter [uncultured Clostridium sp.]
MAQELLRVIRHNTISELSQVLQRMNTVDIAKSMEELDDKSLVVVFRLLTKDTSAEVFSYLDKESQQKIIELITDDEIKEIIENLFLDDIVDIIEQENTEDFQKMAAMEPSEEPYLKTPVLTLAKKRIVWLLVLMVSATVIGSIIQGFEDVLQSVVILASFIPMLMDTGGNSGSQSSTLVIRGLALGEITTKDFLKVIFKEFRVSIVVATVLAIVNFLRLYFFTSADFMISLTVCASLFFTVVLAKIVGGVLPIISKKLKLDPAIMASPLITTIVDAFALIVYFGFAKLLLGI